LRASDPTEPAAPVTAWPTAAVLGLSFAALLALAALGAAFVVGRWSASDEAARAEQALAQRVERDAAEIGELFDRALELLAGVVAHDEWHAAFADAEQRAPVAAAVARVWPSAPAMAWIDGRGRVVIGGGDLRAGDDAAGRRWFDAASRGPLLSDEGGVLRVAAPVHDAARRTAGVLSVTVACDTVAKSLREPAAPAREPWALVNRQSQVLCAQDDFDPALAQTVPRSGPEWMRVPGRGEVLLAAHRLTGSPPLDAQGWRVVVTLSAQAALPHGAQRVWRVFMAAGLVALLVLPLVWLLARRLARPLRELARALDQAREQFEYDPRRIPVRGTREAVSVGQAARAMLGQIAAQQAVVDDSATGYRELFALHPLPMWVVDEQSLRFLEVNQAAASRYGWRRDEFLAMTLLDIQAPEARDAVAESLAATRDQEHHAAVWPHRLRSGETVDAECVSRQLRWGGRAARIMAVADVTSQRRASVQLHRQRRELSELARRLMAAEEAERRELAQVLHDRFVPTLYGAKLSLEALRARAASVPTVEALRAELARVLPPLLQALDASIAETRSLMTDLRPPLLVEQGLAQALEHEVERHRRTLGIALAFVHRGVAAEEAAAQTATPTAPTVMPMPTRDVALDYALFMIAQQALNNALLHAQAEHISVELDESAAAIELTVRDDGRGFDHRAAPPAGHLGLVGMHERARWIGARLVIHSQAGAGTTVQVQWRRAS
jgi:PAS domain S-box-containing protein